MGKQTDPAMGRKKTSIAAAGDWKLEDAKARFSKVVRQAVVFTDTDDGHSRKK